MTKKKKKRLDSLRRLGTVYYELDGQSWRRTILLTQLWDFSEEMRAGAPRASTRSTSTTTATRTSMSTTRS